MLKRILTGIFFAVVFALELWVLSWVVCILFVAWPNGGIVSIIKTLGFFTMLTLYLLRPHIGKTVCAAAGIVALASIMINIAIIFVYLPQANYHEVDTGKANLFADRRVMVIVPHQDDEINLAGGVVEEYIRYGSEVFVVYATNGDYADAAKVRLNEAINALSILGVDEEHIIFLGYGDDARTVDNLSMYNSDTVATSNAGRSTTYALEDHPPFRAGREYTAKNLGEDIHDVIEQYRPDVIYAVGCDKHPDHAMVALLFDRAIGKLLKCSDYTPTIYKGYAYSTAYYAAEKPLSFNIRQTQNPGEQLNLLAPGIYDWECRIRMPVSAASLSRIRESSRLFKASFAHRSQDESERFMGVVNGDKIFWQRESTSISYNADVSVSSGDGTLLTDFVLADSSNVKALSGSVTGVWRADVTDLEPSITFTFNEPQSIARIKLYDDPDPDSNILSACLTFDDGTELDLGALAPMGNATEFAVGAENVHSFTLRITDYEGATPGLTELEVYPDAYIPDAGFIKIMNAEGDFAYDYYIDPSGTERFGIYSHPQALSGTQYTVECIGEKCSATMDGNELIVTCPVGESCTVTISDGEHTDTVFFRNSGTNELPYVVRMCDNERELLENITLMLKNERFFELVTTRFIEAKRWELSENLKTFMWWIYETKARLF